MRKSISLLLAFALMTSGWAGAFLLANSLSANQMFWLIPALTIGAAVGLCLRYVNGKKTALVLALTAALGMATFNQLFPERRVSAASLRSLFSDSNRQGSVRPVKIDKGLQTVPFDKPLTLVSPVALNISLYARLPAGVDDFCFAPDDTLFASLPHLGAVYQVKHGADSNGLEAKLFLHSLDNPTGLLCDPGQLVVAESHQIRAFPYVGGSENILVDNLPVDGGELAHRLQRIPEGLLFSVGSRCDACKEEDPLRATLQLVDSDRQQQVYATGLRNIGGLTFNPADGNLWATERSRVLPQPGAADELNRLHENKNYGWPLCDGDLSTATHEGLCKGVAKSETLLRSRANPAGVMATTDLNIPVVYRNSLLMVLQGDSAYNIVPAVVRLPIADDKVGEPVAFLGGWDGKAMRPSAIHAGPAGAIYIADDINGALYRVAWQKEL